MRRNAILRNATNRIAKNFEKSHHVISHCEALHFPLRSFLSQFLFAFVASFFVILINSQVDVVWLIFKPL